MRFAINRIILGLNFVSYVVMWLYGYVVIPANQLYIIVHAVNQTVLHYVLYISPSH